MSDFQLSSWANLSARHDGKDLHFPEGWLISQIYFPVNIATLDKDDETVLSFIHQHYQQFIQTKKVSFQFAGYADHRFTQDYNLALSRQRAITVKQYLDARMGQMRNYASGQVIPRGKRHATLTKDEFVMAGDRRVDILASHRLFGEPTIGDIGVKAKYKGPLSTKFKFRTLFGLNIPAPIPKVGYTMLWIEIQNARTGKKSLFKYKGINVSIGGGFNRPTKPVEREIREKDPPHEPVWLDVDDFEGPGLVRGVQAGQGWSTLTFEGPKIRQKAKGDIVLIFTGWDFVVQAGADFSGSWVKV